MNLICNRLVFALIFVLVCPALAHAQQEVDEMSDDIVMVRPTSAPALSIDEVVKSVNSVDAPGATKPLGLCYLDQWGEWLVTYHDGHTELFGRDHYHSRTAIYRQTEEGFRLQAEWFSGIAAHLEKPRFFHTFVDGAHTQLLWVPGRVYGTGSYREDAVFELDDDEGMKPVAFEPAPIGYARLHKAGDPEAVMLEGEGVWKGELNVIHRPSMSSGDEMSYTFYVWNKGDGNANPTAGRVDGAYKIIEGEEGLKIEIDTFDRTIFDKS